MTSGVQVVRGTGRRHGGWSSRWDGAPAPGYVARTVIQPPAFRVEFNYVGTQGITAPQAVRSCGIEWENYDGSQVGPAKVGTVRRAKGMDFAAVFHITEEPPADLNDLSGGARDRAEMHAKQLLVAVSNARSTKGLAILGWEETGRPQSVPMHSQRRRSP
ncbi:hypothetical protein ACFWPJ_33735, partial [Nocardia sp. NPDC058497]